MCFVRPRPNSTPRFLKSKTALRLSLAAVTTREDTSRWVRRPSPSATPEIRPGARAYREGPWRPRPRKPQVGLHRASPPHTSRSPVGLRLKPRVSSGAVAPGRRPQGNTCRGRISRTRRHTHLQAGGAPPGGDPGVPGPLCRGPPSGPGARWGKGPRAATALTWQHLLLRRRQQQSRQPLVPSSAAAFSSAAATNRPSGTANRHNRRRPRCRSRPRTPGGREGSGRSGVAVRPLGSGSGAGGQGAAASQSRGAGATRGPQGSAEGSAGPRTRPRLGLLLSTPSLPPRSMPGNGGRGEGCTRWPGRCGEARAGPEVGRQPVRGATPPTVAVGRPVSWLSSCDPGRALGRPVAVQAVVRALTAPR